VSKLGCFSRTSQSSPVHTPLNANGKNISTTDLVPRSVESVTSWPCWSRKVKSGAAEPTSSM